MCGTADEDEEEEEEEASEEDEDESEDIEVGVGGTCRVDIVILGVCVWDSKWG